MARLCNKCANEGTLIGTENEYCRCLHGRQLRAKHDQMLKDSKKSIEDAKAMEKATKAMNKKKDQPNYAISEGDWIEHEGIFGIVGEIQGHEFIFLASHRFDKKTGERIELSNKARGQMAKYVPATLETFDNANEMLVDLALQTGDEKWFAELVKGATGK